MIAPVLGVIAINLSRQRARHLLTAFGIAVGVATIVALLALTQGLKDSANGLIHLGKADFGLFQRAAADPTQSVLPVNPLMSRLRRQPEVTDVAALQLVTESIRESPAAIVFGIEFDSFVGKRLLTVSGRLPRKRGREVMVGDVLARNLHLKPGDTLKIKRRPFEVVGLYHSGVFFEDQGAIVPISVAQRLKGQEGEATTVAVVINPRLRLSIAAKRLMRKFPGTFAITDPGEAARASANIQLISKAVVVIVLIALVIGGISVTNTMIMAMLERQQELALLAAVGWSSRQIALLIFGEGVAVSLIGAGIGLGLGVAASYVAVHALDAAAFVSPSITAWGLGRGLIVGIAIGVFGGIYPAWRVSRLDPARVLARG
jgi:putative ABC transport system permease protein